MVRRRWLALPILILFSLLVSVAPAASDGELAADAVNDPWLSEEGPAVPDEVDQPVDQTLAAWRAALPTSEARAAALERTRLELGLGDLTAAALVTLREASEEDPLTYADLAVGLAPDSPAVHMHRASARWQAGEATPALRAVIAAAWAAAHNLGAGIWLIENLALISLGVALFSSLAFILLAGLLVFPHAAHDLGDVFSTSTPAFARSAALAGLLLIPLVLGEGIVGLALALFALGFAYGSGRQRNALAMAAVLLIAGMHPFAQMVSVGTSVVDADPLARSTIAVLRGTPARADLERLEAAASEELVAAHALAYHERRNGLVEASRARLEGISAAYPSDAVALANRGNIAMRRQSTDEAIDFYERAAALVNSATLLFDLSQAYAKAFRMDEYERTLVRAQSLATEDVAALSALDDAEVVADLAFPTVLLRDRLQSRALASAAPFSVSRILAPGRLGERWFVSASAFALVGLMMLLFADRYDHASLCVRCGHRICGRCQETVWSEEICEDCHHLFQNPEATDPSLRMARLQALSEREVRIDRIAMGISLLLPGAAGFASRRPDLAMLGLLLFAWALSWVIWPSGVLGDPLTMGGLALLCFGVPGTLAVLMYSGVLFASFLARKNR